MKSKIIITSAIFTSLFLSACETASQKVVSGSAASNTSNTGSASSSVDKKKILDG